MSLSQQVKKKVIEDFDWLFFGRFLLIFIPLYYGNLFLWGLVDPRNYYSLFVDRYFNYFALITTSILQTSSALVSLFGVSSIVLGKTMLIENSPTLIMDVPCIGLGIMFFWIAFIGAGRGSLLSKIKWCFAGVAAIWLINCFRVSILLYSIVKQWNIGRYIDAHDMFNYAAYFVILFMILLQSHDTKAEQSLTSV